MSWQPINKAPTNGEYILGYDANNHEWYAMYYKKSSGFSSDWRCDGVIGSDFEYDITPTHWMPLPDLPKK